MPDPDLDKRWGGGGGGGGGSVFKKIFFGPFGPQFGLEIRGGGRPPGPLPGLGTECGKDASTVCSQQC